MHKISIEDIEFEPNKILEYSFDDYIKELDTNIIADLKIKSLGEFIQVTGNAKGKIKLVCDRCLNEYNYDLDIEIEETFAKHALQDEYGQEFELSSGQFVTDLNGAEEIDIYDLLYQSVILNLPNKKVCGINCKGKDYLSMQDDYDPRLDVFKNLQINPKV